MRTLRLLVVVALSLTFCSEDAADSPAVALIGTGGGKVTKSNSSSVVDVELELPPGAIAKETEFTIRTMTEGVPDGSFGPAYDIGPSGTRFDTPATLSISYNLADAQGVSEAQLALGTVVNGAWEIVSGSRVDSNTRQVSGEISHLSVFGVIKKSSQGDAGQADGGIDTIDDAGNDQLTADSCVPSPETCNSEDDDCDGKIDEGFDKLADHRYCEDCKGCAQLSSNNAEPSCANGSCQIAACVSGHVDLDGLADNGCEYACEVTGVELCDGVDNDCDGAIDEDFTKKGDLCDNGLVGVCARTGTIVCAQDALSAICDAPTATGTSEVCNGLDDDCDGEVDEGLPGCMPCVPQPEICNGLDDDCDGQIDEEIPESPCGSDVGECQAGTMSCSNGLPVCNGSTGPGEEICDGLDNNCDGVADGIVAPCYSFPAGCDPMSGSCEGLCQQGTRTCTTAQWSTCQGEVGPAPEVCNGLDDDCDGAVDEDAGC